MSCDNWPTVEERILRASLSLDSMLDPAAQEQYASQQRSGSGDVRTGRKSKKTKKTTAKSLAKVKKGKKGDGVAEASKPKKANGRTKEEKEREREKKKEKKDAKKKLAGVAAESNTSSSRKSSTRSSNRSSIAAELSAAARGGAWSDADDEILEFVREETPSDHRNWSPATTPRANSTTSSSTTVSTTTTMALSLESNVPSQPKKRKGKKGKKRRSTAESNLMGSRSRRSTSHENDPGSEPIVASVENCTMKFGTASTNELLRAYHYASDEEPESKDRVEEDEEENEEEEEEELQEHDDDESGSCSSRYGWQYKNDKGIQSSVSFELAARVLMYVLVLGGESWEQFFENLQSHIAAGLPRREFAVHSSLCPSIACVLLYLPKMLRCWMKTRCKSTLDALRIFLALWRHSISRRIATAMFCLVRAVD